MNIEPASVHHPHLTGQRYRLLDKLGEGGMGAVYRATDRLTGQTIALKRVTAPGDQLQFASHSTDQDFRLSLAQEFRTLAGLRHPHIVSVLDYGFDADRQPYFTMELIEEAHTITEYGARLDTADKVRLLNEMLLALAYLHRRGIIHRDLKPANVLVTADGVVKVMDFGLALTHDESSTNLYAGAVGTLAYMAPELFADEAATVASDLYGVGVIAYELFVGRYPFNTKNMGLLVNGILHDTPDTTMLAIELAAVLDRLLGKTPLERYLDADAVIAAVSGATGQPIPEENAALRESYLKTAPFVGRRVELQRLLDDLAAVQQGRGRGWLVRGESGIGKSRLLEELRIRALVTGAVVLRGQAVEGGGLPYQLWRDPLRRLVLSTELSDLDAGVLRALIPDLAALIGREVPDAPPLDGQAGQQRLLLTILDLFRRQAGPLVLILEDLQWTSENLDVLKQLCRFLPDHPWLLVGSYREDGTSGLAAQLSEIPVMQTLHLDRMGDETMTMLSVSMLGEAGREPRLLELLRRETEGNALFMVEVVRTLAASAGRLNDIAFMTLPERIFAGGIQQLFRQRLQQVSPQFQPLLQFAAICGRQLDLRLLSLVAVDAAGLEAFLLTCSAAAILETLDNQWRFTHDKLRATILDDLSPAERTRLHRTAAELLEATYPDDPAYTEVLLDHWWHAGDLRKILHYTLSTGRRLLDLSEYARSRELVARSLTLLEHNGGDLTPTAQATWQARLRLIAGQASETQGDYPTALIAYQEALELTTQETDPVVLSEVRAIALLGLASLLMYEGELDRAQTLVNQALDLAAVSGSQMELTRSLQVAGMIAYYRGDTTEASTILRRNIALNREGGELIGVARSLNTLGLVYLLIKDYPAARQCFEESAELSRSVGDRVGVAYATGNLGNVALYQGEFEAAIDYIRQSLAIKQEIGDLTGIAVGLNNLGDMLLQQEDFAAAEDYLTQSLRLTIQIRMLPLMLELLVNFATLRLEQGQPTVAALWLGLVVNHPAVFAETVDGNARTLRTRLEAQFDPDALTVLLNQGQQLELDSVVEQILAEARGHHE